MKWMMKTMTGDSREESMDTVPKGTLCLLTKIASFIRCASKVEYWNRMCGISQTEPEKWRVQSGELLKDNLKK